MNGWESSVNNWSSSVDDWGSGIDDWSNSVVGSVSPAVGVWESDLLGALVVNDGRPEEELWGGHGHGDEEGESELQKMRKFIIDFEVMEKPLFRLL